VHDTTDQEEFVRLLTSEQSAIHSFLTSLMPGDSAVDDVLQRTNLVLWRKCSEFTLGTNFRAWAFRCASWQVRAYHKEQKSRNWLIFDEELTDLISDRLSQQLPDSPEPARAALSECLGRLRTEDRDLLLEHYELGHSLAECAERTGRTVNSLKVAFFRLRAGLRRCIVDRMTIEAARS
jgi:RNA polymerase sigma-70 factor (ECF subfamily)